MTRPLIAAQEGFSAGELGRRWRGRGSSPQYAQGLAKSENWWPLASGALRPRPGFGAPSVPDGKAVTMPAQLAPLGGGPGIFHDRAVAVAAWDGESLEWVEGLEAPWSSAQLDDDELDWHLSEWRSTMVTHPALPPQQVVLEPYGMWRVLEWVFDTSEGADPDVHVVRHVPFFKVSPPEASLEGAVESEEDALYELKSNQQVFSSEHVGTRLEFNGTQYAITSVAADGFTALGIAQEADPDLARSFNWAEQLFSPVNGYPTTTTTFAGRLWFAHPGRGRIVIGASKVGRPFDFDVGNAAGDDAIMEGIAGLEPGERPLYIRPAQGNLLLFTTLGIWEISDGGSAEGLKATTIRVSRLLRFQVGAVRPVRYQSTYIFAGADRKTLHEMRYSRERGGYFSRPLTDTIAHRITRIRSLVRIPDVVGGGNDLIGVLDESGVLLVSDLAADVPGWSVWTAGLSAALLFGDTVFGLADRGNGIVLERLLPDAFMDASRRLTSEAGTTTWGGFDYLEGEEVDVWADDAYAGKVTVSSGTIEISSPATTLEAGIAYTPTLGLLPPAEALALRERAVGVEHRIAVGGLRAIPALDGTALDTAVIDGERWDDVSQGVSGVWVRAADGASLEPVVTFGAEPSLEVAGRVSWYKVGNA